MATVPFIIVRERMRADPGFRKEYDALDENVFFTPREVFGPSSQDKALRGYRYREALTQAALAQATGIPLRHISEMERGRRPISSENARLLAEVLQIDPRRLLTD